MEVSAGHGRVLGHLERCAEVGDISPMVHERFLSRRPDARGFFRLDPGGALAAQGRMLNHVLDLVTDQLAGKPYVEGILRSSVADHQSYGAIRADLYDAYFEAILGVVRECCADGWSEADEHAWMSQFGRLRQMIL